MPILYHYFPLFFFYQGGGSIDLSFFSPDCFHFSKKGQSAAGLSLWNNMVEFILCLNCLLVFNLAYLITFFGWRWGWMCNPFFQWKNWKNSSVLDCNCALWVSFKEKWHIWKLTRVVSNSSTRILLRCTSVSHFRTLIFLVKYSKIRS